MKKDTVRLRSLGEKLAKIAALPVQNEKKAMWRALNGLRTVRPMVCMDQLPWHELNVNDELTLQCEDPFLRTVEQGIRRLIYQWNHFPADMVVENRVDIPKTVHGLTYGLTIEEQTLATNMNSDIVSHVYIDQCETEEKLDALKPDAIRTDEALDREHMDICRHIFQDIIPVRLSGVIVHAGVWDRIAQARSVTSILYDIADRPEFIKKAAQKFMDLTMTAVDQCEALGLLDAEDPLIHCTGAYVDDLPAEGYDPAHTRAKDCWALTAAQMFSTVGPSTHEELDIHIMKPLYERFGLLYYGCCEPLHQKIKIIRKISNVRKISVSPWADSDESARQMAGDYVFSGKAHPAFIASGKLDANSVQKQVGQMIQACKDNHTPCEIILKDVSTVSGNPTVLTQWEKLVMSLANG